MIIRKIPPGESGRERMVCSHCGHEWTDTRFNRNGRSARAFLRRHEDRCSDSTRAERSYWKMHGRWPRKRVVKG